MSNILYLMSSANIFGGTPKKTLDLIKHSNNNCSIYFWSNEYKEHQSLFKAAGASVYIGDYGRNIYLQVKVILKIVDKNKIEIIHTQFSYGEILGGIVKKLRPQIKLIITFVASLSPSGIKLEIVKLFLRQSDAVVYISEYVKKEKELVFPFLKGKKNLIIYNGTEKLKSDNNRIIFKHPSLLDVAGLIKIKNIKILIDAVKLIKEKTDKNINLYVAGDGPERENLEKQIIENNLLENIHILGYQKNVGSLMKECDVFVHPCYVEGFGIAVAEAMMAEKPIIVANAGALPELIENNKTGLVVDPFNAQEWVEAIICLIENKEFANKLAKNAREKAEAEFSVEQFAKNYEELYLSLINVK